MEKIFVTGGSGFIGSHLIKSLLELGYSVTNYDSVHSNLNPLATHMLGDIMDFEAVSKAMQGHQIVCHLAAMVGVVECQTDEKKVYQTNYLGSENILKACEEHEINNVLFASSSEVYGEGIVDGFLEENTTLSPLSPYGKAKMKAELLFEEYAQLKNVKSTTIRYCNVYGPRQRVEFVIAKFIDKAINQDLLPVCDIGKQKRNYTFIDDAIKGTIQALFRSADDYQVFNICSDETLKVIDVANKIVTLNKGGKIKYLEYSSVNRKKQYEIINRIPSNKKAYELLDFVPETSFDDGLQITFKYFKNTRNRI